MSVNKKLIEIEVLEIKNNFMMEKNIDQAICKLGKEICKLYQIDRLMLGMKSVFKNECMPILEYTREKGIVFFGEIIDFSAFTRFTHSKITNIEEEYIKKCVENNYFVGEEFSEIEPLLNQMGYIASEQGQPKECITTYMKNKETFVYMVVEKNKETTKLFSEVDRLVLKNIYHMLVNRMENEILKEHLYQKMRIKDAIMSNEKVPICMIEKSENKVIYYNNDYEEYMPNVRLGINYYDLFKDKESNVAYCSTTVRLRKNKGEEAKYWIKKSIPFTLANGTEVYMIYVKNTEDYIQELEGIDLLTSAYSMKGFVENFNILANNKEDYTLCTIDIEKFKYINDSFSFSIGNKILKKVSSVMSEFVYDDEIFCRMNEDKFALMIKCREKEVVKDRIQHLFHKLKEMQNLHFLEIKLTYICGATAVNQEVPLNILIDRANNARKMAKGSHTSTMAFFDEEAENRTKEEIKLENRVAKAVADGEFVPYLQPKFDLSTMTICGAEALVRWLTPTGMIFPDSFIPLFEKNGFINTLDFIIYQKVMEHIRSCLDRGLPVYPISLNVSRNHIQNENFITQIMELINRYEIPVELLELEVTESIFVEDKEILKFFIDNIKRPKIKVSIDDFGTAYSSLQILKDIDIDILKIDKGFLENIDFTDSHQLTKDEVVLKNIINLARDLGCKVICEGIETENQIALLKSIGCEYGQGYVFAKPMPIIDYENKFLKNV